MKNTALRFLRFGVLMSMLILNLAAFSPANRALAQDGKLGNEFDYYSDDTYSCQVGIAIYCNGYTYRSGRETQYVIVYQSC